MYVAMVNVNKLERAATWAVCWTANEGKGGGDNLVHHARLWGSEGVARTHAAEVKARAEGSMIAVVKVERGVRDVVVIDSATAGSMFTKEVADAWYIDQCYASVIGNEVRNICDQTQDDVHVEATARP